MTPTEVWWFQVLLTAAVFGFFVYVIWRFGGDN